MKPQEFLAERFEAERGRLRSLAYRMLGSLGEAEDAVQESWLRLSRANATEVGNLGGWLTTVTARVCLDILRSRQARREESLDLDTLEPAGGSEAQADPEQEALLAEEIGLALLVILETLAPAERVAFVLHDVFDLSFDEIAPVVGRSVEAARQLASRGRRRVRGARTISEADLKSQRATVEAYLAATRAGDLQGLLAVLDPEVVLRVDSGIVPRGLSSQVQGAAAVAERALAFSTRAQFAEPAIVNGALGIVVAPRGRLFGALVVTMRRGKITEIDVVSDRERLLKLKLALAGPVS